MFSVVKAIITKARELKSQKFKFLLFTQPGSLKVGDEKTECQKPMSLGLIAIDII